MKNVLIRTRYFLGFDFHRKGVSATLSCLMVFLLLFLGQTMFPNYVSAKGEVGGVESSISQTHNIGSNTKTIEYLESVKSDILSGKKIDLVALDKVYSSYYDVIHHITYLDELIVGSDSQVVAQIDDLCNKWNKDKTNDVLNNLLELLDTDKYKIPRFRVVRDSVGQTFTPPLDGIHNWESACEEILQSAKQALKSPGMSAQKFFLKFAKVDLITPQYKGSDEVEKQMLACNITQPFIKQAEQEGKKEQRQQKANEAATRKKAEENKAKLAKYNVKAEVSAENLHKNPFQYEGKTILLSGARFDRMLERGLAVFTYTSGSMDWVGDLSHGKPVISTSTQELLVSNVPVDFKGGSSLIVKCKGTTKATNQLGATITLPLVEYIALFQR